MTWRNINITDTVVLCIIALIVFLSAEFYFIPKSLNKPAYTLVLNDADGLIKGSPVLFDGIEVGHVTNLKFDDNQVSVSFVFESDVIKKIPKNSEVTVKATGLAASKALEIYHNPKNIKEDLLIRDSIRQSTIDKVQININRQIIQAANSFGIMSDKQLIELKNLASDGIVTSAIVKIIDKMLKAEETVDKNLKNTVLKDINKKLEQTKNENKN